MLETADYVHCLSIDFSKAFDMVNHKLLLDKLSQLPIHPAVTALISSFLYGRTQSTCIGNSFSTVLKITRGIIQGSGLGPYLFIIDTHDLKAISDRNKLLAYADDTDLLVPSNSDTTMADEFDNILTWTNNNKMAINISKTKQIIFRRPNLHRPEAINYIAGVELVDCLKVLGVFVHENLNQSQHVNFVVGIANQRMYLLNILRQNGLARHHLDTVFTSLFVSQISYAVEAWGNYATKEMENKIDKMFRKAHKWGLSAKKFTFQQLKAQYSERLRHKICSNSNHCLFHLLPPKRDERYDLRPRSHDHQTILASKSLFRKSFIVSTLLDGRYVVNDAISPTQF